jgi:hypothetical protein
MILAWSSCYAALSKSMFKLKHLQLNSICEVRFYQAYDY